MVARMAVGWGVGAAGRRGLNQDLLVHFRRPGSAFDRQVRAALRLHDRAAAGLRAAAGRTGQAQEEGAARLPPPA